MTWIPLCLWFLLVTLNHLFNLLIIRLSFYIIHKLVFLHLENDWSLNAFKKKFYSKQGQRQVQLPYCVTWCYYAWSCMSDYKGAQQLLWFKINISIWVIFFYRTCKKRWFWDLIRFVFVFVTSLSYTKSQFRCSLLVK